MKRTTIFIVATVTALTASGGIPAAGLMASESSSFFAHLTPGLVACIAGSAAWWFICKLLFKGRDQAWRDTIEVLGRRIGSKDDDAFAEEATQMRRNAFGKPSEKYFLLGLIAAGLAGLAVLSFRMIGG